MTTNKRVCKDPVFDKTDDKTDAVPAKDMDDPNFDWEGYHDTDHFEVTKPSH